MDAMQRTYAVKCRTHSDLYSNNYSTVTAAVPNCPADEEYFKEIIN